MSSNNSSKKNIVFSDNDYNNLTKQIETYIKTDSGKKVLKEIKTIQIQLEESIKSLSDDLKEFKKSTDLSKIFDNFFGPIEKKWENFIDGRKVEKPGVFNALLNWNLNTLIAVNNYRTSTLRC